MSDPTISICALFYGDHTPIAARCLRSIVGALEAAHGRYVQDVRFLLNAPATTTSELVLDVGREIKAKFGLPVTVYVCKENARKYPFLRRILRTETLGSHVLWLDDDSYFEQIAPGWWNRMVAQCSKSAIIGQSTWLMPMLSNQWDWIQTQPWYNPEVGPPMRLRGQFFFRFTQGGWWVADKAVLAKYDWPWPELVHNGGDSLFGEMCRHQKLVITNFTEGYKSNADMEGRNSRMKRRGYSENRLAHNFDGTPLSTDHHSFTVHRVIL